MEYLSSVSGGRKDKKVAKELTRDAMKYLETVRSSSTWENCFLDQHSLREYTDGLQKGQEPLAARTRAEKIRRLKLVVEFVNFLSDDNNKITQCCSS